MEMVTTQVERDKHSVKYWFTWTDLVGGEQGKRERKGPLYLAPGGTGLASAPLLSLSFSLSLLRSLLLCPMLCKQQKATLNYWAQ